MKIILLLVVCLIGSNSWAAEIVLRDTECKLMNPDYEKPGQIKTSTGEYQAEYTCVLLDTEATCNFKNEKTGENQGRPTKFEIVYKSSRILIFLSEERNNKLIINLESKEFYYLGSLILLDSGPENPGLMSKLCVGKVIRYVA